MTASEYELTTKAVDWFRVQVKQPAIDIRAEGMRRAQVRQVIIVVGHRLFDDVVAGVQARADDPAYIRNFAIASTPKGHAVHFEGCAIMRGSMEETFEIPDPSDPEETIRVSDPGYIHPWAYRVDWFATHKRGVRVKRIKPKFGTTVICPESSRDTRWHHE